MKYKYLSAFMILYICGIVYYSLSLPFYIIRALFIALAICFVRAKTKTTVIVMSVFTLCFATGYMQMHVQNREYEFFYETLCGRYATVFGTVDDIPCEGETSFGKAYVSYTLKLSDVRINDEFYKTDKKILVYAPGNTIAAAGDRVILNGFLEAPEENSNPGGFNYRQYLTTLDTAATMSVSDGATTGVSGSVFYKAKRLRQVFLEKITEYMPNNTDVLVRAVTLGDKTLMGDDVKKMFSGSGVSHALALSGMHLSILTAFVLWFISKSQIRLRKRAVICSVMVVVYIPVAGFIPSLMRAGIMSLFLFASTFFRRRYDALTAIVCAATVIFAKNPFVVYSLSFQLSFAATVGIIYFAQPLYTMLKQKVKLNRFTAGIAATAIMSVSATVLTLPFIAKSFGNISLYTVLGNLLIIPLIEVLFTGGIVMLILGVVFVPAAKVIGIFLAIITKIVIFVSDIISSLSGAFFILKTPGVLEWLLYASVLFALQYFIKNKKFKAPAIQIVLIPALLCVVAGIYQSTVFGVEFLDVGQGDCALLQIPFGKTVLVDCGTGNYGTETAYIKSKGIRTIDAVYLSHCDSDHAGGLDEMLSAFRVKKVVMPYTYADPEGDLEIINKIIKSGADVEFADNTYEQKIGQCEIEALWPGEQVSTNENLNSLVLKLKCREKTFLFTGDIDADSEAAIIETGKNTDTDVIKVAHHGGKNSSSQEFIEKASPQYAVISLGKNNSYGHPDKSVVKRFEDASCNVFRTDKNGYVHFSVDIFGNYKVKVKTLDT